jgi:hypothetical protein
MPVHVAHERRVREQQRPVRGQAIATRAASAVDQPGAEHGDSSPCRGQNTATPSSQPETGRTPEFRASGSIQGRLQGSLNPMEAHSGPSSPRCKG